MATSQVCLAMEVNRDQIFVRIPSVARGREEGWKEVLPVRNHTDSTQLGVTVSFWVKKG